MNINIKKCLCIITILISAMLFYPDNASADGGGTSFDDDQDWTLMCTYANTKVFDEDDDVQYHIRIWYSYDEDSFYVDWEDGSSLIRTKNWNHKYIFKSSYADTALKKGECPKNGYIDVIGRSSEVCFDDNGNPSDGWCKTDAGNWGTSFNGNSSLTQSLSNTLNTWATNTSYGNMDCPPVGISKDDFTTLVKNKFIKDLSLVTNDYKVPQFLIDLMNSKFEKINETSYQKYYERCAQKFQEDVDDDKITEEQKKETLDNMNITKDEQNGINNDVIESFGKEGYKGKRYCGIFGKDTWKHIQDLYTIVKILIPALIIVLGMVDFMRVLFSGEDKDMKSAGQRFLKRIIAGVIFILLPVLLDFLMSLFGFSEDCLQELWKISL